MTDDGYTKVTIEALDFDAWLCAVCERLVYDRVQHRVDCKRETIHSAREQDLVMYEYALDHGWTKGMLSWAMQELDKRGLSYTPESFKELARHG